MALRSRFLTSLFLLTGLLLTASASAQSLNEGWKQFEEKYNKVRLKARGFFQAAEPFDPNDRSHVDAIDLYAKFFTYGVYLQNLEQTPGKIDRDFQDFEGEINKIHKAQDREAIQPLSNAFRDKVRVHALEVIQFDKARPVHKIHNARLLAKVAELGQGQLADTLVELINDTAQNDGVRFWSFRGLKTLLAQVQPMKPNAVLNKQQETKAAEALVNFLEQRKGPPKDASQQEIDGFRFLRREAVRALAQVHTPSLNEKVRPALVLARIAGADERIQPPPRLDERTEAAIGLARMQATQDKQYQVDYAAGQVAKTIGLFAQTYDKDDKDNHVLPWRVDATRFLEALEVLKTEGGKNSHVAEIVKRGERTLQVIKTGGKNSGNVYSEDETWLIGPQSDSPSKELFQGAADSVVKPAEEGEPKKE